MHSRGYADSKTITLGAPYYQSFRNDIERLQKRQSPRVESHNFEDARRDLRARNHQQIRK